MKLKLNRYLVLAFSSALLLAVSFYLSGKQQKEDVIAILELYSRYSAARNGITDKLSECCPNIKVEYSSPEGDLDLLRKKVQQILSEEPKAIVTIGTTVSEVYLTQKPSIPGIFCSVTDPVYSGLTDSITRPSANMTGVSDMVDPVLQLKLLKQIMPNISKLGMIYNPDESNSIAVLSKTIDAAKNQSIAITEANAGNAQEIIGAVREMAPNVDAIFINNDNTALSHIELIVQEAENFNVPVFSSDLESIKDGVLAVVGVDEYEIGKNAGIIVQKIINGEKVRNIPVVLPDHIHVLINEDKAKSMNIIVPEEVLERSRSVRNDK